MQYRFDQIAINSKAKKKPVEEDRHHYIGLEHLDSGSLVVSRWGADVAPKGEKLLMKKGDVLFGKRRAYQKKVAIAPFDGIFSAHGMVLRPNEEVIDKDFFPMFISSDYFLDTAIGLSVGSLSPTINWKDLARQEFELPSMDKQRELAQVLWAMEETKIGYQQLLADTEELVKSRFVEMFGDFNIELPFQIWKLDCIADIVSGITKGRKTKEKDLREVPYMAVSNVKDGYIDWTTIKTIMATEKEIEQYRIQPNDILMTEGGDPDKVGRGALINEVPEDCIHQNHIFRVRLNEKVNPTYFEAYLQQPFTKRYFLKSAKQTTGIASINMTQLRNTPVIVPPIELQNQFADFVVLTDKSKLVLGISIVVLKVSRILFLYHNFR